MNRHACKIILKVSLTMGRKKNGEKKRKDPNLMVLFYWRKERDTGGLERTE